MSSDEDAVRPTPSRHTEPVEWFDTTELRAELTRLDGPAYLQGLVDGSVPMEAFPGSLGVSVLRASTGSVTLSVRIKDWHVNVNGMAHGGFLSTLLDIGTGLAVHSALDAGRVGAHVQANWRFLRPAKRGMVLECTGEVVRLGRTIAVARAEVTDEEDKIVALGDSTHAYLDFV